MIIATFFQDNLTIEVMDDGSVFVNSKFFGKLDLVKTNPTKENLINFVFCEVV